MSQEKILARFRNLSPEKRALLVRELRDRRAAAQPAAIPPRNGDGAARLSFSQRGLWLIHQLAPWGSSYNVPFAMRVRGVLDRELLWRSLKEVVRRHEILRTTFVPDEGQPWQRIHARCPVPFGVADLRRTPPELREREAETLGASWSRRPFDLERGPLLRVLLVAMEPGEHVLFLVLHHIVCDGWSDELLFRELLELYRALGSGETPRLPDLPVQYADYAEWQLRRLEGARLDSLLAYWRKRLQPLPPALELPVDRPRRTVGSRSATVEHFELSGEASAAVAEGARALGATSFMVLLAAFDVLLWRYTGQDDVVLGTPVAQRTHQDLENLIGFFVNTLVLRTAFTGDLGFDELVDRVRATVLEAQEHQEMPFEKLVEELRPGRNLGHAPLFQILFAFQDDPAHSFRVQGLELIPERADHGATQFDLIVVVTAGNGRLYVSVRGRTDLFDRSTLRRMAGHYENLLQGSLAPEKRPLSNLPLLSRAERHQLFHEWGAVRERYDSNGTVLARFSRQVAATPDAVAVVIEGCSLSYGELDRRARGLAEVLRGFGVAPEVRVGITLDPSLDLVVAIAGVLRAQGVCVPMDPVQPEERLAFIASDAGVQTVLTQAEHEGLLSNLGVPRVRVDGELDPGPPSPVGRWPGGQAPGHLGMYLMYTSGSTGRPKGVMVSHGNVVRLFDATREVYGFGGGDTWSLYHSYGFDFSVWELWGGLLHGGRVVVVPYWVARSPVEFRSLLCRERVTVLSQTPSAFYGLSESGGEVGELSLRWVVFGGEALEVEGLRGWWEREGFRGGDLVNMYGITETTVHVTWHRLGEEDRRRPERSVIGRGLGDLSVSVVDSGGEAVPVGVVGEVHVGGAGVSRGYRGRAGWTAERFVPDGVSPSPGSRLYRTGDVARWLGWGELEYVGRLDDQVQLRGFRVELGEVESALSSHPSVSRSVVTVRREGPSDVRLVGYVVGAGGGVSVGDVREHVAERLPAYMVPSWLVVLEELPLTASGKVDRGALPAPESVGGDVAGRGVVGGPVEEALAGVWSEVLGVEGVGPEDDFFELGGHSLLATRVVARVREALGVELRVQEVFERSRLGALAEEVSRLLRAGSGLEVPSLVACRWEGPERPVSFAQERLWFLDRLSPGSEAYHVAGRLELSGDLSLEALRWSLCAVVRRHEVLRTRFVVRDGAPVGWVEGSGRVVLPVVDLVRLGSSRGRGEASSWVVRVARLSFDLSRGPLLRGLLVRLGPREHVLGLTVHHAVFDGWSLEVLVRELGARYRERLAGESGSWAPLGLQYGDYARWQREWLEGEVLEGALGRWRDRLSGVPEVLELPADRPGERSASPRGARREVVLGRALMGSLESWGRREGATPFMVLLAGFGAWLHRLTGQEEMAVGTPVAGRGMRETEELIGFFVNTLVLRVRATGEESLRTLVGRVREEALWAYGHQEVPFERLVEALQPERELGRHPVFQVLFALQTQPQRALELPGLRVRARGEALRSARFDLSVTVYESEDRGWLASVEYDAQRFDATTVTRWMGGWVRLLEAGLAAPERSAGEHPPWSRAERHQVLVEWDGSADRPEGVGVWELFARAASRRPEAVAVSWPGAAWSYAGLSAWSGRVAAGLREAGVGTGARVVVVLAEGPALVAWLLGVVRAGGAFVGVSPNDPVPRAARMVSESAARVAALERGAGAEHREALAAAGARVVEVAVQGAEPSAREAPAVPVPLESPVYVVYTSGSTGEPKGIVQSHGSFSQFLQRETQVLAGGPEDRVACWASTGYDAAYCEILGALVGGATSCLAPRPVRHDPRALLDWVERERITVLETVPSFAGQVLEQVEARGLPSCLRCLSLAGEALPLDQARRWLARGEAGFTLYNRYGPSESVLATASRVGPGDLGGRSVPVGRPIPGRGVEVLDARGCPCPLGVVGEIHLASRYLTTGYLARPAETASGYRPDGGSRAPGLRAYATGDLGRWLLDGRLEYVRRRDAQVKLRGMRVELAEIEAVLAAHPAVRECAAAVETVDGGDQRLVAHVVVAPEGQAGAEVSGEEALVAEHVARFTTIYDEIYGRDADYSPRDPGINRRSWTSSYTGHPLPDGEILACVDETAARIRALGARRVLELGAGSGLILSRVAPGCDAYWGTDVSREAVRYLEERFGGGAEPCPELRLLQRAAHDFTGIEAGAFDAVVLNLVVQHFSDAAYLVRVLEGALRVVRPGGCVFVGSVRSLALLEAFHASVQLERAPAGLGVSELRTRWRRRLDAEQDLVVDPAFFEAFAAWRPEVGAVDVALKKGGYDNEIDRFQYDVTLRLAPAHEGPPLRVRRHRWRDGEDDLEGVARRLEAETPEALVLEGVPNARVLAALRVAGALSRSELQDETVEGLRRAANGAPVGVDPADVWALEGRLPYSVTASWAASGASDRFDALLRRRPADGSPGTASFSQLAGRPAPPRGGPWERFTNERLPPALRETLEQELVEHARKRLPAAVVPATLWLQRTPLPRTRTGKLDRRSLPALTGWTGRSDREYVAPRNPTERTIAAVWAELLGLERIGVHDDFFQLGGHSLLATRALNRLQDRFASPLEVRHLFELRTVAALAERVDGDPASREAESLPEILRRLLDRVRGLSNDEARGLLNLERTKAPRIDTKPEVRAPYKTEERQL